MLHSNNSFSSSTRWLVIAVVVLSALVALLAIKSMGENRDNVDRFISDQCEEITGHKQGTASWSFCYQRLSRKMQGK